MKIKKTLVLDLNEAVSKAKSSLSEHETVIVTKSGKYYGTLDSQSVAFHGAKDLSNVKCDSVSLKPPVLAQSSSLTDQVESFLAGNFHSIPVVSSTQEPLGVVTRVGVVEELVGQNVVPNESVSTFMSTPVYSVSEKEPISKAKQIMKDKNLRKLLVLDSKGFPFGFIWASDISHTANQNSSGGFLDKGERTKFDLDSLLVRDFVRPGASTVSKTASLIDAASKMIKNQHSEVVVLDGNAPSGVLSSLDLFRLLNESSKETLDVQVSGAEPGDSSYLVQKVESACSRFAQTLNIKRVTAHVKYDKSTVELKLHAETGSMGMVSISEQKPTFAECADAATTELHTLLRKEKDQRKVKPRSVKREPVE